MPAFILQAWNSISNTGTFAAQSERERKDIVILNRAWIILIVIQTACLCSHLYNHLYSTALLTGIFIGGLFGVHTLLHMGRINAAKITAITVINYNSVVMGIFLGPQTHIIDFLLLTALMPLYFFEIKKTKLIFWGIAISIVPYTIYYFVHPYLSGYALPLEEQLNVYKTTVPMKILSLSALLFLIYQKNAIYEKEVNEKEAEIIGQKKLYERILEQIPIDIVTFDKELNYTYINSTAIKDPTVRKWLIGKKNADYFRERNLDMKTAAERDRILHEALQQEKSIQTEETLFDRHGEMKYSLKGASPIYSDDKKELLCLVGYSLDITGIKEAERKLKEYATELERKNDDLHHFVNATSHDLKTPLRNIASYLQLIERKNANILDEESLAMMGYTVKSVKHLNQLIGDIYQYSVADRNDKPAEVTNLTQLVTDTLMQMESTIAEKNAVVQCSILPTLRVAPSHMGMVFSNLVGNAIKYNQSKQPHISISCQINEDNYVFSIKDNGIGIQKEYQKQIFEIFRRLHTPDEYEGTGVGLAITNKIVENYGGKMWVESEAGQGSTFFFSLPKMNVDPETGEMRRIGPYSLAIAG